MNLIEARDAVAFHEAFDGRRWTCFRSGKVCAITYARIQGKQAMIQRFQNSSLLAESLEVQPRRATSANTQPSHSMLRSVIPKGLLSVPPPGGRSVRSHRQPCSPSSRGSTRGRGRGVARPSSVCPGLHQGVGSLNS